MPPISSFSGGSELMPHRRYTFITDMFSVVIISSPASITLAETPNNNPLLCEETVIRT